MCDNKVNINYEFLPLPSHSDWEDFSNLYSLVPTVEAKVMIVSKYVSVCFPLMFNSNRTPVQFSSSELWEGFYDEEDRIGVFPYLFFKISPIQSPKDFYPQHLQDDLENRMLVQWYEEDDVIFFHINNWTQAFLYLPLPHSSITHKCLTYIKEHFERHNSLVNQLHEQELLFRVLENTSSGEPLTSSFLPPPLSPGPSPPMFEDNDISESLINVPPPTFGSASLAKSIHECTIRDPSSFKSVQYLDFEWQPSILTITNPRKCESFPFIPPSLVVKLRVSDPDSFISSMFSLYYRKGGRVKTKLLVPMLDYLPLLHNIPSVSAPKLKRHQSLSLSSRHHSPQHSPAAKTPHSSPSTHPLSKHVRTPILKMGWWLFVTSLISFSAVRSMDVDSFDVMSCRKTKSGEPSREVDSFSGMSCLVMWILSLHHQGPKLGWLHWTLDPFFVSYLPP